MKLKKLVSIIVCVQVFNIYAMVVENTINLLLRSGIALGKAQQANIILDPNVINLLIRDSDKTPKKFKNSVQQLEIYVTSQIEAQEEAQREQQELKKQQEKIAGKQKVTEEQLEQQEELAAQEKLEEPKPQLLAGQTQSKTTGGLWSAVPNAIYFYDLGKPYDFLTNFYAQKDRNLFKVPDGLPWKTSEHYFQAHKFRRGSKAYLAIYKAQTPREAFEIAQEPASVGSLTDDHYLWHESKKYQVMHDALRYKFEQNPDLKQALLYTGNNWLIEDSPIDAYWGVGKDGNGDNDLGRMLMLVRQEIKDGKQYKYNPGRTFRNPRAPVQQHIQKLKSAD